MKNAENPMRDKLRKRHTELSERLGRVARDGRHAAGLNPDFAEQAVERENDDVLAQLDTAIRAEILQVDRALERIADGRYGVCERCNKPIAESRLDVLPYAALCAKCEEKVHP